MKNLNRYISAAITFILVGLLFSGCRQLDPESFSVECSYQCDENGRETLHLKGFVTESAWGVSSIDEIDRGDHIELKTVSRFGGNGTIDKTVNITNAHYVTLDGEVIWESEPYRKVFMTNDFDEYTLLWKDGVPLPGKFVKIPSPLMRKFALESRMSGEEIDNINLLLELRDDITPLWGRNPRLALQIINGKTLKELSEDDRLYLLNLAIRSGTSEVIEMILDTGIDPDYGFFKRKCAFFSKAEKYWRKDEQYEGDLPTEECLSGIAHSHGLVHDAVQSKNLAAVELLIRRGVPYSQEDKIIIEKMRNLPLDYLPPLDTLARLEALHRAGIGIDDPRMGLNNLHRPPLKTVPEMYSFTWQCTTGTYMLTKYLLDHGVKDGLKELFDWGIKWDKIEIVLLAGDVLNRTEPMVSEETVKYLLSRYVRHLIARKGNLDKTGYGAQGESTILAEAVNYDCFDAVRMLVENHADINLKGNGGGETPLYCALRNGNLEMVKYLLGHGAEIHSPEDILVSGYSGNLELIKFLLERGEDIHVKSDDSTLLLYAAHSGNLNLIRFLVEEQKFPVNETEQNVYKTVLYAATSQKGSLEVFDYLLAKGAVFDSKSKDALILMDIAAQWGNTEIIARLAGLGVSVKGGARGNTPLHWAAAHAHEAAVRTLLSLGADPNMKNHMDLTVSEFAAMFRGTENVRQIIQEFQEKAEAQ